MITLTDKAKAMIEEISNSEGIGHYCIRIKVMGGGCAGMTNDMFFDDVVAETDEVFEFDGVKLVIDFLSFQYLDGTSIDYLDTEFGGGFKFINPNVKSSCGCGSSYSA